MQLLIFNFLNFVSVSAIFSFKEFLFDQFSYRVFMHPPGERRNAILRLVFENLVSSNLIPVYLLLFTVRYAGSGGLLGKQV